MSVLAGETPMDVALDRRIPMGVVRDTVAIIQRNLIAYRRVPQLLVFSTIQPVIFVVMFRYVFGGAVSAALPAGVDYVDYLMPGIFVQTVVFGAIATAIGLATDMKSGLMERFHALPMARSAVLSGRTLADTVRNVFVVALMMAVGFLVGWRIHTDVLGLARRHGTRRALRLLDVVDLRDGRPRGRRPGDGPGGIVPRARAARLRLVGVRAGRDDARRGSRPSPSISRCPSPPRPCGPSRSAVPRRVT